MGKVIAPLHSIQVRGKVGEILFRRWRNINTVSSLGGGAGVANQSNLVAMRAASASWGGLTYDQMEAWRKYAMKQRVGDGILKPTRRSGYMTYALAAYLADQCGESYPDNPPETKPPNYLGSLWLGNDLWGSWAIRWDGAAVGEYVQVKAICNAVISKKIFENQLKDYGISDKAAEEKRLDGWATGKYSKAKARLIRASGQAGPWNYIETLS